MLAGWCRLLGILVPQLLLATPTLAAEPAASECSEQDATACGRQHFERGTKAFEADDFAFAAAEFQLALAQRPHPVIRFNLGLSFARLGRPLAAIEQLEQVQRDAQADPELRGRAEREARSAAQALSRVTFRLADPTRESVELDGAPVQLAREGELSLDPGTHHVRVISGSSVVLDQELELAPGERVELRVGERSRRIDVVVVPDPSEPKVLPPPPVQTPRPGPRKLAPAWFYAGAGTTVVLTGLTVWSGLDTRSALSAYESDLPRLSQTEADARVRSGHARELRTNLLLTGSLLCAAGSAVLGVWFTDFGPARRTSFGIAPTGVNLSARF